MIYDFHFVNYKTVFDLEAEFRRLAIKSYCYEFYTAIEVIKYGKGNDLEWQNGYWGNRAVRQADAFHGWFIERYTGCNSKLKFKQQLIQKERWVHKDTVSLKVFDYTQECASLSHELADEKLLVVEGNLVNAYKEQHGTKPVLNIAKTKGEVAGNNFKQLFDFG